MTDFIERALFFILGVWLVLNGLAIVVVLALDSEPNPILRATIFVMSTLIAFVGVKAIEKYFTKIGKC